MDNSVYVEGVQRRKNIRGIFVYDESRNVSDKAEDTEADTHDDSGHATLSLKKSRDLTGSVEKETESYCIKAVT